MIEFNVNIQTYRVSDGDIKRIVWDHDGAVMQRFRRIGRTIVVAARAQVGKETGALARSIHYNIQRWGGLPELKIGSASPIAYIHHEGTRPHAISARGGQFLRFSSKGRVVYDRTVMHPGTKPNRFLTDNLYLARL